MVLVLVLTAVSAFIGGFIIGTNTEPVISKKAVILKKERRLEPIEQEYMNFLNYDGTEQP